MTEMIKKLESVVREVLSEIKTLQEQEASLKGRIQTLDNTKLSLEKTIALYEAKYGTLKADIEVEAKAIREEIEARLQNAAQKELELTRLVSLQVPKVTELNQAKQEAVNSKTYYDARAKEYDQKLAELAERKAKMQAAISA